MALAARRAVAQGTAWSMASEYPATTVSGEGITFFADQLAKESSGRLTIAPSYDAPGGLKSADIVAAIRDGRLAAGDSFAGALGRIDPLFALSSLPFVATGPAEARRLLDAARGLYANRFAREKQRLLYATPWPASGLWAKKPIVTPADLAGLPLRVYDSTGFALFAAAGARPANLSFADVMPRIVDGSIEAVLSSGDGGAGRKLWNYLPYFTEIGYAMPLSFGTLSQPLYDGLPADLAGLPLRVYDSTGFALFAAAGARPANLSFADVMPRIVDGSIEAVLSSGDGGAGRKLWNYLPYFTEIGYAMPLSFGTLSQPLYDGLPADLRAVVDRCAQATQAWLWELLTRRIEENHARLEANKVTIVATDKVSPALRAELVQAASGAIETWQREAGPEAAAVLDAARR
jgi:TRAP-type C4-dicarboxylate transport system substrate-binding protein